MPKWKYTNTLASGLNDVGNVLVQNQYIDAVADAKRNRAKLVPLPEIDLAVRTPHGLTAEERAAEENRIRSTKSQYRGSDFNKGLVAKNMNAMNQRAAMDKLAQTDAALYRESYNKSIEDENANRQAKAAIAMENANRQADFNAFKLKADVDRLDNKRKLFADVFNGVKKTLDQNRAYTAGNMNTERQEQLSYNTGLLSSYDAQLATLGPEDVQAKANITANRKLVYDRIKSLLDTPLPEIYEFKYGGRVSLIPKR